MAKSVHREKIKPKTVVEQVMNRIRDLIASGEFKANDRIPTESELAESFGIGRSSIREAIKVFNYIGVLESRTAKGTYVCERAHISTEALTWAILLGRDDYHELIDMRGAMEMWSLVNLTRHYAAGAADVQIRLQELEDKVEQMRLAVATSDNEALARADYDFHGAVISGGGNRLFASIYGVLRSFMYEEIEKSHRDFSDISSIIEEHQETIDAIRTGDALQAQEVVRRHIASIKQRLENVLKK